MEENDNGMGIEVRNLTGESIRVFIEPNRNVHDLKLLLRQCFSPASSSNDFHLYLRGVKLKLRSCISNCSFGDGEFLVLVPFTKKDKLEKESADAMNSQNSSPNVNLNMNSEAELVESAWVELIEDLSSLRSLSNNEMMCQPELRSVNFEKDKTHSRRTSQRKEMSNAGNGKGYLEVVLNILENSVDNTLDELSISKFLEFIDSSSCLSCPETGCCVASEANDLVDVDSDPSRGNGSLCCCPFWLKDVMRSFCFVNTCSAWLQLQQKKITLSALERPLTLLNKSGFRSIIAHMEILSEVCPQVIRFVDSAVGASTLDHTLVILKGSEEKYYLCEDETTKDEKRLPKSKIIRLMKRRESLLKDTLSRAVKSLKFSNEKEKVKFCSLEDFIYMVKKTNVMVTKDEVKQERKRYSASCSGSFEGPCRVNHPFDTGIIAQCVKY